MFSCHSSLRVGEEGHCLLRVRAWIWHLSPAVVPPANGMRSVPLRVSVGSLVRRRVVPVPRILPLSRCGQDVAAHAS